MMEIKSWSLGIIYSTVLFVLKFSILISFTSKDYISLQAPSHVFIDWLARLREPISHSIESDIDILFIYRGPKVHDLPFPSRPESGRRDSIIGTNRHWPELLAVKKNPE
jgi:hypothetical protein